MQRRDAKKRYNVKSKIDHKKLYRMGVSASNQEFRELPNKATDATLYYFAGRGLADQIR